MKWKEEFCQDAVRIALTSGLTRKQVADDIGVGMGVERDRLGCRGRRVGRLMCQNGMSVVRTRKYKVTTDSDHKYNITPNLLNRNFNADAQTTNRLVISAKSGPARAGFTWL